MDGLSLLLRFLRPRIFQRNRAVEDELTGLAVGVEGEAGETLELVPEFRLRLGCGGDTSSLLANQHHLPDLKWKEYVAPRSQSS